MTTNATWYLKAIRTQKAIEKPFETILDGAKNLMAEMVKIDSPLKIEYAIHLIPSIFITVHLQHWWDQGLRRVIHTPGCIRGHRLHGGPQF
jgi:hypothetical protein